MKQFILKNQTTILILLVAAVGYISYKMFYKPTKETVDTLASAKATTTTAAFDGNLDKSPIL